MSLGGLSLLGCFVFTMEELLDLIRETEPPKVIFWDEAPFLMHKARPPPDPWPWFNWLMFLEFMKEDLS